MLPAPAKLWILEKIRKKRDKIFRNYFSCRTIDDFDLDDDGNKINKIPYAQIRWLEARLGHNRIYIVRRFHRNPDLFKNNVRDESLRNLKVRKYTGLLTEYSILGIKRAFEKMLVFSEPFMCYEFKTKKYRSATMIAWLITVPFGYGPLSGKTFNQLVSQLIKRIGQKYPDFRMYIGKNEYTDNGMEHCHLDVNTFIDYYWLHKSWFSILKKQSCFQSWLKDHPTNDPDHPDFSPKSKDNLVGYRPLWTSSRCVSYLNNYLKKMSQNKNVIKGRVWFQSKYLARRPLPLILFSNDQQQKLQYAKEQDYVNVSEVSLKFYAVDEQGVVSDDVHHSKNLCTIFKQKSSKSIYDFLTDDNRKRLIRYRTAARDGVEGPTPHGAVTEFKVIWARDPNRRLQSIEGRPPGINPPIPSPCPDIQVARRMLDKRAGSQVFYSKVKIDRL